MGTPVWRSDLPPTLSALLAQAEECEGRGRWSDARQLYKQAIRDLGGQGDAATAARVIRREARCLIEEGALDAAVDTLELARNVSECVSDISGVAHATNLAGIVAQRRGDLEAA